MDKKKQVNNAEVRSLPPVRLELGDIASLDPDWHDKSNQQMRKFSRDIEGTVKRIIAHLEEV